MSEPASDAADVIRTDAFSADGPVDLDLHIGTGSLDIELTPADGDAAVQVDVRHDPAAGQPWSQGLASALSWVNEQFGDQFDADLLGSAQAAVDQTRIELLGSRLTVRAPKALPLRHLPLAITVRAPEGSRLEVRTTSARVTLTGRAARAEVTTTSGDVSLERVDGEVQVRTGGGDVRLAAVEAAGGVVTSTGSVWIARVEIGSDDELTVRSGSGDLAVTAVTRGAVSLRSGSGDVRAGLADGVLAEIDLASATGRTSSELDVSPTPPEDSADDGAPVRLRASSGSGSVTVTGPRD